MTSDAKPFLGEMTGWAGCYGWTGGAVPESASTRLLVLAMVSAVGLLTLLTGGLSGPAESQSTPAASPLAAAAITSPSDPAIAPVEATPASPAAQLLRGETAPSGTASLDGLKIASQSWKRGGLGSNALVTFTLRNRNDYAVRDIGIFCAFTRADGSHLTDRTRTIHDTVNMKSRKTFARVHIAFINVNADKAKCALVAASRI